ncbi:FUSC family protein [Alkaliphilus transvaalensis]|uniref:FUSC family protein n=1 Tax=Alkaliphilus transvaalensis TaxID=114628 RepID=UPI0004791B0C|nr:aromatic acid exporter family protein [Alkaliphilus transvaalensis]
MKIGLRTIKTGIAVSLSMLVANLLQIGSPFFAMVAALIAIQPTITDSWKIGFNRMLGTLIGAIMGVVFAIILPSNFILAGIGIIILIYLMNRLGWNEAINIAGVVFIVVFLGEDSDHISYALNRLYDTFIGIGIAVIVNYLIYPPTYDSKAVLELKKVSRDIWKYHLMALKILLNQDDLEISENDINLIDEEIKESEKFLNLQLKEEKVLVYGERSSKEIVLTMKLLKENFQHFLNLYGVLTKGISPEVINLVKKDFTTIKETLEAIKKEELEILDGGKAVDLKPVIKSIQTIKKQLKFSPEINNYPTDEVVKMLVILYNLEETLSKFNIIKSF